jgi:succinate dehydrogenase / fumarate reductase flavoprotein subunit
METYAQELLVPFDGKGGENPYTLHQELQDCMQNLVGIIRVESELKQALEAIARLKQRLRNVSVAGHRQYNPGWHLALDLHSLLSFAEASTIAAIERKESRGGHTRDDYPNPDPKFAKINIVLRKTKDGLSVTHESLPEIPEELKKLLEEQK